MLIYDNKILLRERDTVPSNIYSKISHMARYQDNLYRLVIIQSLPKIYTREGKRLYLVILLLEYRCLKYMQRGCRKRNSEHEEVQLLTSKQEVDRAKPKQKKQMLADKKEVVRKLDDDILEETPDDELEAEIDEVN